MEKTYGDQLLSQNQKRRSTTNMKGTIGIFGFRKKQLMLKKWSATHLHELIKFTPMFLMLKLENHCSKMEF
jgi:hypothetical protein